ncbi:MAG: biotin-dependent carboxyltransferase family protein [Aeromicrobium sp.]
MIEVLDAGWHTTVQDRGRPGLAHLGVPTSGAADHTSHALGQRLVGNSPDAAGLEVTLGGLVVRATVPLVVAVTGAVVPVLVDGLPADRHTALRLDAGAVLSLGTATRGLRCYLSVAGGVDCTAELGSRSTDTHSGLGPPPVASGDVLPVGRTHDPVPPAGDAIADITGSARLQAISFLPGPRVDRFEPGTLDQLTRAEWVATDQLDRVGVRLSGPRLQQRPGPQIASEGMELGSIQVPASGQPIVFLADHPPTGGYPVIGVVRHTDVAVLAQARPGSTIRFVRATRAGR